MQHSRGMGSMIRGFGSRVGAMLWTLVVLLCVLTPATARAQVQITTDIPYPSPAAPGGQLMLDLYTPDAGPDDDMPVIIVVHGGGYCCGNKSDGRSLGIELASRGYSVVIPAYTYAATGSPSFPKPVTDIFNVIRWVRTAGAQRGLGDLIVLTGHSAGGTIAATVAYSANVNTFINQPPAGQRGYTVDAFIGMSGRYDILWDAQVYGSGGNIPTWYLGVVLWTGSVTLYNQATATRYVDVCSPPTTLYHGSDDTTVRVGNSYRLRDALLAANVDVRLTVIQGGGHDPSCYAPTVQDMADLIQTDATRLLGLPDAANCNRPGFTRGACCRVDGTCAATTAGQCTGAWTPLGTCAPNPCPQPTGSCCTPTGECVVVPSAQCPNVWSQGRVCLPNPCPGAPPVIGACCVSNNCFILLSSQCPYTFYPDGVCSPSPCPVAGLCCRGCTCNFLPNTLCGGTNVVFLPGLSDCGTTSSPCCHADFNKDRQVAVDDIFAYLGAWFSQSLDASITSNGTQVPSVPDIFGFLGTWFGGCVAP